jgi:hypothetical protein
MLPPPTKELGVIEDHKEVDVAQAIEERHMRRKIELMDADLGHTA